MLWSESGHEHWGEREIFISSQTDHTLQFARRPQTSCGDKDRHQISPCRPLLAQMEKRERGRGKKEKKRKKKSPGCCAALEWSDLKQKKKREGNVEPQGWAGETRTEEEESVDGITHCDFVGRKAGERCYTCVWEFLIAAGRNIMLEGAVQLLSLFPRSVNRSSAGARVWVGALRRCWNRECSYVYQSSNGQESGRCQTIHNTRWPAQTVKFQKEHRMSMPIVRGLMGIWINQSKERVFQLFFFHNYTRYEILHNPLIYLGLRPKGKP